MTIARRFDDRNAIVAPAPRPPVRRPSEPREDMRLPRGDAPAPETVTPAGRLRRCTYRRVDLVSPLPGRPVRPAYEIMCLYDDRDEPLALGDLAAARSVCEACAAPGIFRADED